MNFQLQCKWPWHLFQWFPFNQLEYNAQILYCSKISINFTWILFPSYVNVHIILKDIIQLLLILFKRWSYDKIWKFSCKIMRFSDLVLQICIYILHLFYMNCQIYLYWLNKYCLYAVTDGIQFLVPLSCFTCWALGN